MATINGRTYQWSSISISMLGNTQVSGVGSISYEITQEKKNIYGAHNQPVGRVSGAKECTGSIKLTIEEINKIRAAMPAGSRSLTDIPPFDITVSYNNGVEPITTDTLRACEFKDDKMSLAAESTDVMQELGLVIGVIDYGV